MLSIDASESAFTDALKTLGSNVTRVTCSLHRRPQDPRLQHPTPSAFRTRSIDLRASVNADSDAEGVGSNIEALRIRSIDRCACYGRGDKP